MYPLITSYGLVVLEVFFVSGIILLLYRMKDRYGLGILYVFLGSNQYIQTILASTIYIHFGGNYFVSPGSIVLFSSSIFAISLVYLKEGISQTRSLIYGILVANFTLLVLTFFTRMQLGDITTLNILGIPNELFDINLKAFLVGTVTLLLDAILVIILYTHLFAIIARFSSLFGLMSVMLLVLYFDGILFITGVFWGQQEYTNIFRVVISPNCILVKKVSTRSVKLATRIP